MKKILTLIALMLCLLPQKVWAQGDLGFGESEDATMSLMERVSNIEQKFKAFNVYVNFAGNGYTQQLTSGGDFETGFKARQLRLEMKGQIGDHFLYRIRHRLNRSNVALNDNFAKATDIMMIGYRVNPQWLIAFGKMGQYFGGLEFEQNGIYVYQGSDINNNSDGNKVGISVTWNPVKGQQFVAQVTNTYNDSFENEFHNVWANGVKESKSPLTLVGNWNATMMDGLLRTSYSYHWRNLAEDTHSQVIILGQSINGSWGRVYLDYGYEKDDIDFMRFCTPEASRFLTDKQPYLTDMEYHQLVARTDVKMGKHLILWAEGMYQTASSGTIKELRHYRDHYTYMGGIEFVPDPNYKIRYTLNYQGNRYSYSKECRLDSYNTNRIEVGILCRLKCF